MSTTPSTSRPDLDEMRARYDRLAAFANEDAKTASHAAAIAYSIDLPPLLDYIAELERERA